MSEVFLKVVNLSISAGWLVLAVLVLRLLLKKAPRWISVLLWGLVAVRLICPFSFESGLSLVPSPQTIPLNIGMDTTPEIQSGVEIINSSINPIIAHTNTPHPGDSVNPLQITIAIYANIWVLGLAGMLIYMAVSYWRLRRRLRGAVRSWDNIFRSEQVPSPFVLGIVKPRIYLPAGLAVESEGHVIAHERAHIRRKDHWWKPLGFLLLSVYWFNPLMWVAYILLCRDIELACDEKVIAQLGKEARADYSQALLDCSVHRRRIVACPLAFGEVGVKKRVKSILHYRKPTFWVLVIALTACVITAVCFLTDPNVSRKLPMEGSNVADLNPEEIVNWIFNYEDVENSNIYMNSNNFTLTVDSAFNWADSQAIRYFFWEDHKTYSGQLRIFPEERVYFLTESDQWVEQERIFLLRYYLDALKYLPQAEIRAMAPADRYLIEHIDGGQPGGYDRVITYSNRGVGDTDGWYIHLRIHPLHRDAEGYSGSGEEWIELFYGDYAEKGRENAVLKAKILEIHKGYYLVEPVAGSPELGSASRIEVPMQNVESSPEPRVGDLLEIEYDGMIQETWPARIPNVYHIDLVQSGPVAMVPTDTELTGLQLGALLVPMEGQVYRYALMQEEPVDVTAQELLFRFTEDDGLGGIDWEVFTLNQYPDRDVVMLISGTHGAWLYAYDPPGRWSEEAIDEILSQGNVVLVGSAAANESEKWQEFVQRTRRGEAAQVRVIHYQTLSEENRFDRDYLEIFRQDYPCCVVYDLSYDGNSYTLTCAENVTTWKYLIQDRAAAYSPVSSKEPEWNDVYILTNKEYATWEQIWKSLASSAAGAAIDHVTIYTEPQK